jgi:hypothetical protein
VYAGVSATRQAGVRHRPMPGPGLPLVVFAVSLNVGLAPGAFAQQGTARSSLQGSFSTRDVWLKISRLRRVRDRA